MIPLFLRLHRVGLFFTVSLALCGIPTRAGALAVDSSDHRGATAREHYSSGRYVEAARVFEAIWRDTGESSVLYNAGMAREAAGAGHEAYALHDWRHYLAVAAAVSPSERADLERRIGIAAKDTVQVELAYDQRTGAPSPQHVEVRLEGAPAEDILQVTWTKGHQAAPLGLTAGLWIVRLVFEDGSDLRQPVNVDVSGGPIRVVLASPEVLAATVVAEFAPPRAVSRGIEATWEGPAAPPSATIKESKTQWTLAPGAWVVTTAAPGYLPLREELHLSAGQTQALELRFRRDPAEQARLGLAIADGATGLGLLTGGAMMLLNSRTARGDAYTAIGLTVGDIRASEADPASTQFQALESAYYSAATDALVSIRATSHGYRLVGAGVGLGVVGATVGAGGKEIALSGEAGLGLTFLAAGIPWLATAMNCYEKRDVGPKKPQDFESPETLIDSCRKREIAPSLLLGTGSGLLAGAAVGLVTRAILRRRGRTARKRPLSAGVVRSGLALSGRF